MPGIGPRSAERIALWMVRARNDQPEQIARAVIETRQSIRACILCGFFTAGELCEICGDPSRSAELLCVVEQPTDILPLEKTGVFRGRYHSLGGRISPLFKPRWSPDLMLSANYLTHFCVMRTEHLRAIGGWRTETDGAQDWDLFFRVIERIAERSGRIEFIDKVLYHWGIRRAAFDHYDLIADEPIGSDPNAGVLVNIVLCIRIN